MLCMKCFHWLRFHQEKSKSAILQYQMPTIKKKKKKLSEAGNLSWFDQCEYELNVKWLVIVSKWCDTAEKCLNFYLFFPKSKWFLICLSLGTY